MWFEKKTFKLIIYGKKSLDLSINLIKICKLVNNLSCSIKCNVIILIFYFLDIMFCLSAITAIFTLLPCPMPYELIFLSIYP